MGVWGPGAGMGMPVGEEGTACVPLDLSLQASLKLTASSGLTEDYFWTIPSPSPLSLSHHPSPHVVLLIPKDTGIGSSGIVLSTEVGSTEPGGAGAEGKARM